MGTHEDLGIPRNIELKAVDPDPVHSSMFSTVR
jgi:hypothetical protein